MRRMLYLSYWIFMQANMATATASEWVPARQTPNAIYCVPPTLQPPLATSSLSTWTWVFRPKCSLLYNTHNYRQIEATNSLATHTHAHIWRAGSLANANDHPFRANAHPPSGHLCGSCSTSSRSRGRGTHTKQDMGKLHSPLSTSSTSFFSAKLRLCSSPLPPAPVSLWSVGMRSLLGAAVVVGGWRRRRLCSISKYERIIQTYIYRCAYVCACACVCVCLALCV